MSLGLWEIQAGLKAGVGESTPALLGFSMVGSAWGWVLVRARLLHVGMGGGAQPIGPAVRFGFDGGWWAVPTLRILLEMRFGGIST